MEEGIREVIEEEDIEEGVSLKGLRSRSLEGDFPNVTFAFFCASLTARGPGRRTT